MIPATATSKIRVATAPYREEAAMAVHFFVDTDGQVAIFHDQPFSDNIAWIELTPATGAVEFVREDGSMCDFGVHMNAQLLPHFKNAKTVTLIHADRTTGRIYNGQDIPLTLQQGDL